jgi:hypothetical protein
MTSKAGRSWSGSWSTSEAKQLAETVQPGSDQTGQSCEWSISTSPFRKRVKPRKRYRAESRGSLPAAKVMRRPRSKRREHWARSVRIHASLHTHAVALN